MINFKERLTQKELKDFIKMNFKINNEFKDIPLTNVVKTDLKVRSFNKINNIVLSIGGVKNINDEIFFYSPLFNEGVIELTDNLKRYSEEINENDIRISFYCKKGFEKSFSELYSLYNEILDNIENKIKELNKKYKSILSKNGFEVDYDFNFFKNGEFEGIKTLNNYVNNNRLKYILDNYFEKSKIKIDKLVNLIDDCYVIELKQGFIIKNLSEHTDLLGVLKEV